VVARAREVLERLEREAGDKARLDDLPLFAATAPPVEASTAAPVAKALADLDLDGMSPREAQEALYRLKGML
jgi:DNA mismatch repair protein MutS